MHGVIAPVELPQHYVAMVEQRQRRLGVFLQAGARAAAQPEPGEDVLVVGAPHFLFGQLGGYLRDRVTGARRSARWIALADANCAHRIVRSAGDRVEVEPLCREGFFPYGILEVGDEVRRLGWTVRVLAGHPHGRFEVRFDRPIEEMNVRFVAFEGFADRTFRLPAVGAELTLAEPASWDTNRIDAKTRWLHTRLGP